MKYALITLMLATTGCEHTVKLDQPSPTPPAPANTVVYDAKAGGVWITGDAARSKASDVIYCAVENGQPKCTSLSAQ